MRSTGLFGLLGIAALLLSTSCSHTPESFCQSWVQNTCAAISNCCASGESYDQESCELGLSQTCLGATDVDMIQDGQYKFDYGSAEDCFGTVSSCGQFQSTATDTSYAHTKACANVVTGYRPLGAACGTSADCQKNGDFSTCYDGSKGGTNGVCAQVVSDTATCSFSFATLQLHVCADGMFCDTSTVMTSTTAPPSSQAYEFSATCVPEVTVGGNCASNGTKALPCAAGLFCDVTGTNVATCTELKSLGATCTAAAECGPGLDCVSSTGTNGQTCQTASVAYCFAPTTTTKPVCGDGVCTPPETAQTCPQDCGTQPTCVTTCAVAVTSGGTVCAGNGASSSAYDAIVACADANCTNECADLQTSGADSTCANCLTTSCANETQTCGAN